MLETVQQLPADPADSLCITHYAFYKRHRRRYYQIRETGFSFTNIANSFTDTDTKPGSALTTRSRFDANNLKYSDPQFTYA